MSEPGTMTESSDGVKKIYFFIGRTTPPHSGHIRVLCKMIEKAKASKTPALILLGDGPNGGERTRDNPISHETKAAFIQEKLSSLNYQAKIDFVIEKMKQPPNKQVVEFVNGLIDEERDKRIEIIQVAGKKGLKTDSHAGAAGEPKYDDLEKHLFVRKGACKELRPEHIEIEFNCDGVEGVDALSGSGSVGEMSATKVRNAAVGCFTEQGESGSDRAFECWLERFPYYRDSAYSRNIFDEIIRYKDTELTAHKKLTNVRSARKSPSPSSSSKKGSRSRLGKRSRPPSEGGSRRRNRGHKITRRLNRRTRGRSRGRR
jgi:hypothetical protein